MIIAINPETGFTAVWCQDHEKLPFYIPTTWQTYLITGTTWAAVDAAVDANGNRPDPVTAGLYSEEDYKKDRKDRLGQDNWVCDPKLREAKGPTWYEPWDTARQLMRDAPEQPGFAANPASALPFPAMPSDSHFTRFTVSD